jgi:hypothetical protein
MGQLVMMKWRHKWPFEASANHCGEESSRKKKEKQLIVEEQRHFEGLCSL